MWGRTKKAIGFGVLVGEKESLIIELEDFIVFLESMKPSPKPRYVELDEWQDPVREKIDKYLKANGHIPNDRHHNESSPVIMFWRTVYSTISFITSSAFIETKVARHHASAKSRNNALIKELSVVLNEIKKVGNE